MTTNLDPGWTRTSVPSSSVLILCSRRTSPVFFFTIWSHIRRNTLAGGGESVRGRESVRGGESVRLGGLDRLERCFLGGEARRTL